MTFLLLADLFQDRDSHFGLSQGQRGWKTWKTWAAYDSHATTRQHGSTHGCRPRQTWSRRFGTWNGRIGNAQPAKTIARLQQVTHQELIETGFTTPKTYWSGLVCRVLAKSQQELQHHLCEHSKQLKRGVLKRGDTMLKKTYVIGSFPWSFWSIQQGVCYNH